MLGISGGEFLVIVCVALAVLGPDQLSHALRGLRRAVDWFKRESTALRRSSGGELSELGVDLSALERLHSPDYDPRAMVREAVRDEMQAWIRESEHPRPAADDGHRTPAAPAPRDNAPARPDSGPSA